MTSTNPTYILSITSSKLQRLLEAKESTDTPPKVTSPRKSLPSLPSSADAEPPSPTSRRLSHGSLPKASPYASKSNHSAPCLSSSSPHSNKVLVHSPLRPGQQDKPQRPIRYSFFSLQASAPPSKSKRADIILKLVLIQNFMTTVRSKIAKAPKPAPIQYWASNTSRPPSPAPSSISLAPSVKVINPRMPSWWNAIDDDDDDDYDIPDRFSDDDDDDGDDRVVDGDDDDDDSGHYRPRRASNPGGDDDDYEDSGWR